MRSARLTAALLGLAAIAAPAAPAQEEDTESPDYLRDGWYVGLQYNRGIEDWSVPGGAMSATTVGDSNGLSAYVGWRFLEYWGIDFQYEWQNSFASTLGSVSAESNTNVFTVNGRAYLPLGRIQPFVLAGLGLFQSTTEVSGSTVSARGNFAGRLGGGVDLYITENWVLSGSATYILPSAEQSDRRYLSVAAGLQYRFDPYIY